MSCDLQMTFRRGRMACCMAVLLVHLTLLSYPAAAQQFIPGTPVPATSPADVFPQDSKLARQLTMAQEELAAGNYRVGLRRLGLIVGSEPIRGNADVQPISEDHFYSTNPEDLTSFGSLKAAAREIIAGLPPDGLEVYEDLYGRVARVEFDSALADADMDKMAEIARRYFHTAAGYEAAYHVAAHHMDHGRPMAAVRIYMQLLKQPRAADRWEPMLSTKAAVCWARLGRASEGADVLAALKNRAAPDQIVIGGARRPLFPHANTDTEQLAELFGPPRTTSRDIDDYKLLGGNHERTQVQADSFPFMQPKWQSPATENIGVREVLTRWMEALADAEDLSIPAVRPILVGDLVIVKTIGDEAVPTGSKIRAYDLHTGALVWQTTPDATFDPMRPSPQFHAAPLPSTPEIKRNTVAEQRAWHDHTFADLASDGETVYSIEELDVLRTSNGMVTAPLRPYNLLRAYNAHTGKAQWEVGGGPGEAALPLAETFFLGPPLPLEGRLYCIAEQDRHVRLLVLNPDTGQLLWAQSLFALSSDRQTLVLDIWRRMAGLSPAYSQGLIVCPTGLGGVIAFDIENRQLQWHFTYRNDSAAARRNSRFSVTTRAQRIMPGQEEQRWLNTTPLIAGGRVLVAPQDTREFYCLDVLTGKLLWRKQQLDRLQIVGVHDDRVVVLGKDEIEAFDIETGHRVFEQPVPIPRPSGRAVLAGSKVLVPLSTAELLAVDLTTGTVARRAAAPDGSVPGNLLCLPEVIISHGLTSMMVFEDLDRAKLRVAQTLETNPRDLEALLARAEIAQQEGDLDAAIEGFRQVVAVTDDLAPKTKLLDLLLAGLQADFPAYESDMGEIVALLDDVQPLNTESVADATPPAAVTPDVIDREMAALSQPDRRAVFLRSAGQGYAAQGNVAAALKAYLEYAEADRGDWFDNLQSNWGIRRDRWFAARVAELIRSASPEDLALINRQAERELEAALNPKQAAGLRRFVTRYSGHPLAEKALRAMVDATAEGIRPLETEFALLRLRRSPDDATAAFATAKLAALAIDFDRYADAAGYLKDLRTIWGDTLIWDNKTGRELVASWSEDPLVSRRLGGKSPWPLGRVDVNDEKKATPTRAIGQPVDVLEVRERQSPPLTLEWSPPKDTSSVTLIARSGDTKPVWSIEVPTGAGGRINFNSYARACGDLTVIMSGNEILAIDALGWRSGTGGDDSQTPSGQVLWRRYLDGPYPRPASASRSNSAWGVDSRGRRMGELGPVTPRGVFYQSGRSLFAADPMTGETLWQRGGIEHNSRLFADDDRLMVVSREGKTAAYYSMIDGRELGTRDYISGKQLVAAVDGNVLSLAFIDDQLVMQMQHLWSGDILWKREFHLRSHYVRVGHDEIAVLQPDGQLTVLNVADGVVVFETEITYVPGTKSLAVLPSDDIYAVIVNHPTRGQGSRSAVPSNHRQIPVNGTVYGIERRTGKLLWSQTVEGQAFDLRHPTEIPLLVFANRVVPLVRASRFSFALLCLDKRTGQTIYETNAALGPVFDYDADETAQVVTLDLGRSTLKFSFTDEPVGEETTESGTDESD